MIPDFQALPEIIPPQCPFCGPKCSHHNGLQAKPLHWSVGKTLPPGGRRLLLLGSLPRQTLVMLDVLEHVLLLDDACQGTVLGN